MGDCDERFVPAIMDIVFVAMPFSDVDRPSIGVSLLKAEIAREGFRSRVFYFNLDFAAQIGSDQYRRISGDISMNSMVGEWFFADSVFGREVPAEWEYVNKILSRCTTELVASSVLAARRHRPEFLRRCAETIRAEQPRIVAFTTTFHQTCACLALAKVIKSSPNPPIVIFGGANCEGEMGLQLLRSCSWIDYVCTGEGDFVFPAFVENILRGDGCASIPGILHQGDEELTLPEAVLDLDALPIPDYSDYVDAVAASPIRDRFEPTLLVESSRGCWWGAKQHCTFCGLNGRTMTYRSKSAGRTYDELAFLRATYGIKRVSSVDNILDTRYITALFPRLRDGGFELEMFYEVKANLRLEQLALMRAGGVCSIQPGIESLNNDILRRMRKGCTGLQNLQVLRWAQEVGIIVAWNILGGFPGESESAYQEMASLIPLLTHLTPPTACAPIRLDRFSPFYTHWADFGLRRVRPTAAYYYCFPFGRRELGRLAYFFDFDYADGRRPAEYMAPVQQATRRWHSARNVSPKQQPRLQAEWLAGDELQITDSRPCAEQPQFSFRGTAAKLYAACDSVARVHHLVRSTDGGVTESSIKGILNNFVRRKLMVEMEDHYLSLAIMQNRSAFPVLGAGSDHINRRETTPPEPLLRIV